MLLRAIGPETGENLRNLIAESISPSMLFNRATASFPSLRTELRKYPVARGTA